ncbi:MAG: protein-L-isoaspartate O-methyltransferase, partial [Chloroflexi bacterium]|nr:protein-L-isoaspartate O-methyltransferase [Chloroflexota bacterium]
MERELERAKRRLLEHLAREISDKRVLSAMARVPREAFIPKASIHLAYEDIPLPIGQEQTISQPIMVAMMTEALAAKETDSVLEIGTGSGYQAAVLSLLSRRVITVERFPELAERAEG